MKTTPMHAQTDDYKKKDNMKTHLHNMAVTTAQKHPGALTHFRGMRRRGMTGNLTGIDAELDLNTGEILKTYAPGTGELLLEFPPGAIPHLERKYVPAYFTRDQGVAIDFGGGDSAKVLTAEKLVGYAVVRDLAGLQAVHLEVSDTKGWTGRTGKFVSEENAIMMSFAGIAWAARQGIMPSETDLALPLEVLSETAFTDWTAEEKIIPVANTLKWKMSEVVVILNRHSGFIRRMGRILAESGSIKWWALLGPLIEEMQAARKTNPERFVGPNPTPFSMACA